MSMCSLLGACTYSGPLSLRPQPAKRGLACGSRSKAHLTIQVAPVMQVRCISLTGSGSLPLMHQAQSSPAFQIMLYSSHQHHLVSQAMVDPEAAAMARMRKQQRHGEARKRKAAHHARQLSAASFAPKRSRVRS